MCFPGIKDFIGFISLRYPNTQAIGDVITFNPVSEDFQEDSLINIRTNPRHETPLPCIEEDGIKHIAELSLSRGAPRNATSLCHQSRFVIEK